MKAKALTTIQILLTLSAGLIGLMFLVLLGLSSINEGDREYDKETSASFVEWCTGLEIDDCHLLFGHHYDYGIDDEEFFALRFDDDKVIRQVESDSRWEKMVNGPGDKDQWYRQYRDDMAKAVGAQIPMSDNCLYYSHTETDEEGVYLYVIGAAYDIDNKILYCCYTDY